MLFRDTQETLAVLDKLDTDMGIDDPECREQELMKKFGFEDEYSQGRLTPWMRIKPKIWSLFDGSYSSQPAKVSLSQ